MKEHTIVCNSNGTYSAKLNRVGYVGSANRNPKFAIEQAKRGPNLETTVVHASCPTTELDAPLVAHAAAA